MFSTDVCREREDVLALCQLTCELKIHHLYVSSSADLSIFLRKSVSLIFSFYFKRKKYRTLDTRTRYTYVHAFAHIYTHIHTHIRARIRASI